MLYINGGNAMTIQCCVCRKVKGADGEYKDSSKPLGDKVSHGYCPKCAEKAFAEIENIRKTNGDEEK